MGSRQLVAQALAASWRTSSRLANLPHRRAPKARSFSPAKAKLSLTSDPRSLVLPSVMAAPRKRFPHNAK
jgi:hypothetical protein